jgi:cytosine/adenosine deaminase-related metal-dependent hydrolase
MDVVECAYLSGRELTLAASGQIAIDNGRIADLRAVPKSTPSTGGRFAFPDCLAIPALTNAHVHLRDAAAAEAAVGQVLEQAVIGPESTRMQRLRAKGRTERVAAMRRAVFQMGRLGVSLVGDFCDGGVEGVLETREATAGLPMDIVILGRLRSPQTPEAVRANAPLNSSEKSELDQLLDVADGFATATVNDYSDEAWRDIRSRVRSRKKLLCLHLAESAQQRATSLELCGRDDVTRALEIEPDQLVHLTQIMPEDLDRVIASEIPVVACPRSNGALGLGYPPIMRLLDAHHPVALGTDNVMLNSGNLWRELEYSAKAYRAIERTSRAASSSELLACVMAHGARAFGREASLGSIERGKRADLVIVGSTVLSGADPRDWPAILAHRLEPYDILGRFHNGVWLQNDWREAAG